MEWGYMSEITAGAAIRKARMFPGVDIDAIHYKLGAIARKKAA